MPAPDLDAPLAIPLAQAPPALSLEQLWPLAILPIVAWLLWALRRSRRSSSLLTALRGFAATLVILALCQPILRQRAASESLQLLIDVSQSVSPRELASTLEWLRSPAARPPEARLSAIAFANGREALIDTSPQQIADWLSSLQLIDERPAQTNVDEGLARDASQLLFALDRARNLTPWRSHGRVALLTDGQIDETGEAELAQIAGLGLEIHALELASVDTPAGAWIHSVQLPERIHSDAASNLTIVLSSDQAQDVTLEVRTDTTSRHALEALPGRHEVELAVEWSEAGWRDLQIRILDDEGVALSETEPQRHRRSLYEWHAAVHVLPQHRVLLLAPADHSRHFEQSLRSRGFRFTRRDPTADSLRRADLNPYDVVVMSNVTAESLDEQAMEDVVEWVRAGGGLLFAGGEATFGEEGYRETALETILPFDFEVEDERSEVAVMIALDKSYSMKGRKMELAKAATAAAFGVLDERHRFGLVTFDWNTYVTVPLQFAGHSEGILEKIQRVEASAQTNFFPALESCFEQLGAVTADVKHVILVSDGRTYPDEYERLIGEMREAEITISTVAIGTEADRELLGEIATWGGGSSYAIDDPSRVESILIDETEEQLPDALEEDSFVAEVVGDLPETTVVLEETPPLLGRISTLAKESAHVVLAAEEETPLLGKKHVGLGKVWMFAADLEPKWSANWFQWSPYGAFFSDLLQDLSDRRPTDVALATHPGSAKDSIVFEAIVHDARGRFRNGLEPKLELRNASGELTEATLRQTGPGRYRSADHDFAARGVLAATVRASEDASVARPGAGVYVDSRTHPEAAVGPARSEFLAQLTSVTGGAVAESREELWSNATAPSPHETRTETPLRPWIALAALAVFLLELLARRLGWGRRGSSSATAVAS